MPDKPVMHGGDHRPGGLDPNLTGPWHLVGGDDVFAGGYTVQFLSGANMAPTADIPNPVPMRFRMAVGAPNVLTYNYLPLPESPAIVTGVDWYTYHQIEIQGDITDVNPGDLVFILPIEYTHDHDVPCHSHDDNGNYVPCRLLATGEFYYYVP